MTVEERIEKVNNDMKVLEDTVSELCKKAEESKIFDESMKYIDEAIELANNIGKLDLEHNNLLLEKLELDLKKIGKS